MLVLTILLVLIIFSFYRNVNRPVFALLILLIVLIESIRWESGTDFDLYLNNYSAVLSKDYDFFQRLDFLYYPFSFIFSYLKINYTVFLFILSFLSYIFIFLAVPKFTNQYYIALLFLLTYFIGSLGANRQIIALCIVFYCVTFLKQNDKWYLFLIGSIIASLFHISAIVSLPMFFFNRQISVRYWAAFILTILIVSLLPWQDFLYPIMTNKNMVGEFFSTKMKSYFDGNFSYKINYLLFVLAVLRRSLIVVALIYYHRLLKNNVYYNLLLNISFLSLGLYIFCALNFQFLLGRLTIYYSIFDVVVFSWLVQIYSDMGKRNEIVAFMSLLAIVFFFKSISVYPELFIPYKTRFFVF